VSKRARRWKSPVTSYPPSKIEVHQPEAV
jgi:hypothetical protein